LAPAAPAHGYGSCVGPELRVGRAREMAARGSGLASQHAVKTRVAMTRNQAFFRWTSGVGGRHHKRALFFVRPPRKGTETLSELAM
jgi:hypothetical protein